jgi:BCD family chlorophyll transporter-like MFS transporter
MFFGGALRDLVNTLATQGVLGQGMAMPSVGYSVVYHVEMLLLFMTLMAVGPLVERNNRKVTPQVSPQLGLAELSP